jgi:hypothetical protein
LWLKFTSSAGARNWAKTCSRLSADVVACDNDCFGQLGGVGCRGAARGFGLPSKINLDLGPDPQRD